MTSLTGIGASRRPCQQVRHSVTTKIRTVYRLERKIISTDAGYEFNLTTGAQYPVGDARFAFAD